MTVTPKWGLSHVVPEDAIAAWGARLIVTQTGDVDMLPDRNGSDGGPHVDELFDLMEDRFPIKELRATISELLKEYRMSTREGEDFIVYMDDRLCFHANTNGSAGYCYVTAWLWPAPVVSEETKRKVEDFLNDPAWDHVEVTPGPTFPSKED